MPTYVHMFNVVKQSPFRTLGTVLAVMAIWQVPCLQKTGRTIYKKTPRKLFVVLESSRGGGGTPALFQYPFPKPPKSNTKSSIQT